jgi:nitronate monooxygenase
MIATRPTNEPPVIIQGGMGVGVSDWRLARAVSLLGQLGVVSGTALDQILARRLQDGDPGGHMRRGLEHFPVPGMAESVWRRFYIPGGKQPATSYQSLPLHSLPLSRDAQELCIVSNFVEVWLARQGHDHPIGINYLEKIQIPHLPSIFGAMLAGVGYVLMGAGIPLKIPGALDKLARYEPASYPLSVTGTQHGDDTTIGFVPGDFVDVERPPLLRPRFLAIVASNTLATTMLKKANGEVNGLIVEGHTAGGHNAPPRGKLQLDALGEPVYGERDRVDLDALRALGVPFWLAGGYGSPQMLQRALAGGAAGVQVGTAFALCAESGLRDDYKHALRVKVRDGDASILTDPRASPTGFPFKIVGLAGSISEQDVFAARPRICDLGYLREAYRTPDGSIGYRCAAEPVSTYVAKGGNAEDTIGRKCICNALIATGGHPQVRAGRHLEAGVVTAGDALADVTRFLPPEGLAYSAADVIRTMLGSHEG